ncbi:MAG: PAS domain S-box protein [Chloroflexi bacterium]|nr:PAS domain S-box protein [Chloroflexota bacterium]
MNVLIVGGDSARRFAIRAALGHGVAVVSMDNGGVFSPSNHHTAKLFGWTAEEVIGRPWQEVARIGADWTGSTRGSPGRTFGSPSCEARVTAKSPAPLDVAMSVTP